jgi:hypothetical protein
VACNLEVDVGSKVNRRLPPGHGSRAFRWILYERLRRFHPYPRAGLDNRPFDIGKFMAASHQGLFGVESLVNHMRPDPGRPFMSLPPYNPAAVSVLYTFPRLQPTALAISVTPFPCFLKATIFAWSKVGGRPL